MFTVLIVLMATLVVYLCRRLAVSNAENAELRNRVASLKRQLGHRFK